MTLSGRIRVREQFLAQEAVVELGSRAGGGRARAGGEPQIGQNRPKMAKNGIFLTWPGIAQKAEIWPL